MTPQKIFRHAKPNHATLQTGIAGIALLLVAAQANAAVKLAPLFADGMVVQRDRPIPVWGTATPNTTVTVEAGDARVTAKADAAGRFRVALPARPAGGPFELRVTDGEVPAVVRDVLAGDVWLCSGQSNMQMSLAEADNGKATAAVAGRHTRLRLCKIGQAWTDAPQDACQAKWSPATPESAGKFTAVGYFFAEAMLRSPTLKDVPIGVIESDLGGTLVEAWTPRKQLDALHTTAGDSMFGIKPTTLYNGMIAPLGLVGLKGVVWYQGEGNAGDPAGYPAKLTAMIDGWREQFQNPTLPFLIVQLPDYAGQWGKFYWQWQRDAQQQVAANVPNVGLVTSINTNDGLDLHPKAKQAIGERAALLARQTVYKEPIVGRGPVYQSAEPQGDHIRVRFDTAGGTLAAADPKNVAGFMIAGDDGTYRRATAVLDGDGVVLRSDLVAAPKTVRYAWAGVPDGTLTNADGLPAYPFRTDTLPPDSVGSRPLSTPRAFGNDVIEFTAVDGLITGLTVHGKQLLSNESGPDLGINLPGFLGPTGMGPLTELGPDLYQFGIAPFAVRIEIRPSGCTWTVQNDDNDARTIRINLSPLVKASAVKDKRVVLNRPGASVTVVGIDKMNAGDAVSNLEVDARPHETTTFTFDVAGN